MPRPDATEYGPFHGKYVGLVPEDEVLGVIAEGASALDFLRDVPEADALVLHPPYTWSIKQVVGHMADTERIFGYRALRIARGDATPLPGFEEHDYAQAAGSDRLPLGDLVCEFESLRRAHTTMFANFPEESWARRGIVNDTEVSARALAYMILGHQRHHEAILRQRLGLG